MKDKVLRTAVTSAAETIAQALHSYSDKQIMCKILICSRYEFLKDNPDVLSIKVEYANDCDRGDVPILKDGARVTYSIDHGNELIRNVEYTSQEGGKDGP